MQFYCDLCKPQYQALPIKYGYSMDDDGELALQIAEKAWNNREYDDKPLRYWEK